MLLFLTQLILIFKSKKGITALYIPGENSHYKVVELLLQVQVDPDKQSNNRTTALIIAIHYGKHQVVEIRNSIQGTSSS